MRYVRTTKKRTSYLKRHLALSSVERMDIKQIERCLNYFLLVKATIDSPLPDEMDALFHGLVETYTTMKVIDVPEPAAINRRPVALTFNDINEDTCYNRYRFLKPDLWRLHKALKLDEFGDGYIRVASPASPSKYNKFGTEEALLILLQRLAFPTRFADMVSIYNRDINSLSKIFSWMNNYIRTRFGHLIKNNWDYWKDDFEEFAERIRKKVVEKSEGAINYPPGSYLVFGLIDDTTIRTCRPGGGPAEAFYYCKRHFIVGTRSIMESSFNRWSFPMECALTCLGRSPTETLMLISSLQVAWFRHYLKLLEAVSNLQSMVMESFLP